MMKRGAFCVLAVVLLTGQTCPVETEPSPDGASGYRKVTLTGTIQTDFNEATLNLGSGEGLTVMEYAGTYSFELWFPMAGGQAVQQQCWIALTEGGYTAEYYGTATPCVYTPLDGSYAPRYFELEATLTPNGIYENDVPVDELSIHLTHPLSDIITVNIDCGGAPADMPDPTTYAALSTYWYANTLTIPIQLNVFSSNSYEGYPLLPPYDTYDVDITQTELEETVSSLE